jgi:signal transduction histidine kinase
VIMGYLQLLDEGIYGELTPKQREVNQTLANQAGGLSRLVKQLLDVSRFEAGGGRIEPRPVKLVPLLEELERAFQVLALQRGIDFRIQHGADLPDEVQWDLDRVNEVIGNLLSNAFKFTPRGGRVDLIARGAGDSVTMEVRDTGAGIAPDQLPRIFDKFFQADNQGDASATGTGLGLAIAKQIVEAHGGEIACDSTPGKGTAFILTLPHTVLRRSQTHRTPALGTLRR